ncbi:hypothetical protein AAFP35_24010 [Gordonia sp. CPCC 206044]|uniref:hypothetical protein n=1 Tax=Gordonia sp. CPCC 206044 TaxID=3140793 RepID=UPI003AF3D24E
MSDDDERPLAEVHRELRVQRAAAQLAIHGTTGNAAGFNMAANDLFLAGMRAPDGFWQSLFWALSHVVAYPDTIRDHLLALHSIPDDGD